jgi:hypothetical protein
MESTRAPEPSGKSTLAATAAGPAVHLVTRGWSALDQFGHSPLLPRGRYPREVTQRVHSDLLSLCRVAQGQDRLLHFLGQAKEP